MATTFQKIATTWKVYKAVVGCTMIGVAGINGYTLYQQQKQLRGYDKDERPMRQMGNLIACKIKDRKNVQLLDGISDLLVKSDKLIYCDLGLIGITGKTLAYGWAWPYTAYKLVTNPKPVYHMFYNGFYFGSDPTNKRDGFIKAKGENKITYVSYLEVVDKNHVSGFTVGSPVKT